MIIYEHLQALVFNDWQDLVEKIRPPHMISGGLGSGRDLIFCCYVDQLCQKFSCLWLGEPAL